MPGRRDFQSASNSPAEPTVTWLTKILRSASSESSEPTRTTMRLPSSTSGESMRTFQMLVACFITGSARDLGSTKRS